MKQVELRLALVLYGGVSLAVYMHGITREILNVIRAADRCSPTKGQARAGPSARPAGVTSSQANAASGRAGKVLSIYQELLESFHPQFELKIVLDVLSGASAGGINAIMLARALAHNLDLDQHRQLWLEHADIASLRSQGRGSGRMLRRLAIPILRKLLIYPHRLSEFNAEMRKKIDLLCDTPWNKPPFSGNRFCHHLFDACEIMDTGNGVGRTPHSLIPVGQSLDLFVTVTDFYGYERDIFFGRKKIAREIDHRRVLNFQARHLADGVLNSEFSAEMIPALCFAARATASFPVAFAPGTIEEIERAASARLSRELGPDKLLRSKIDPGGGDGSGYFIDGSVVMNKPFTPVIEAIARRPAMREIDRRLIYVDPTSAESARREGGRGRKGQKKKPPGLISVVLSALSTIPRHEPIGDALELIEEKNRAAHQLAEILSAAEPAIQPELARLGLKNLWRFRSDARIGVIRFRAIAQAARSAGFLYPAYREIRKNILRRKIIAVLESLTGVQNSEPENDWMDLQLAQSQMAWSSDNRKAEKMTRDMRDLFDPFLHYGDVAFRIRNLEFVIRRLNGLYADVQTTETDFSEGLDRLKACLYSAIDRLRSVFSPEFVSDPARAEISELIAKARHLDGLAGSQEAVQGSEYQGQTTPRNQKIQEKFGKILEILAGEIDLASLDRSHDKIIHEALRYLASKPHRRAILEAYVGFPFYDLIIQPFLAFGGDAQHSEITFGRISPLDAHSLHQEGIKLKGRAFGRFGGFFNRAWREHDYLWGRLSSADHLFNLILSVSEKHVKNIDHNYCSSLKAQLFDAILDEEAAHLSSDPQLIGETRNRVKSFRETIIKNECGE